MKAFEVEEKGMAVDLVVPGGPVSRTSGPVIPSYFV